MEIPKSVPDFLLVEIGERCTRDVFIYVFESVCIVNKNVYPALYHFISLIGFINNSFLTRYVQRDIEIILGSPITFLLTGTFGWVSLCSVGTYVRMIGKALKWEFCLEGSEITQVDGERYSKEARFELKTDICCDSRANGACSP
ncbi:hypothetical protein ACFX2C_039810 [Malus domestica]